MERTPFESNLPEGRRRFLAHVIEHGLAHGRRTHEDFIAHFPPSAIMEGLADHPTLRANIIVIATGVRPKIALRKSVAGCAEDLDIALAEDETDAETVVTLFDADDRVRYLPAEDLWSYITDGEFWQATPGSSEHRVAREHIAFMLDRALKDGLIAHEDIVEGITVAEIAQLLPRAELASIVENALAAGRAGEGFSERALLAAVPCSVLVEHVPLATLWDRVVLPRIAHVHAYQPLPRETVPPPEEVASLEGLPADELPAGVTEEPRAAEEENAVSGEVALAPSEDDAEEAAASPELAPAAKLKVALPTPTKASAESKRVPPPLPKPRAMA